MYLPRILKFNLLFIFEDLVLKLRLKRPSVIKTFNFILFLHSCKILYHPLKDIFVSKETILMTRHIKFNSLSLKYFYSSQITLP